MWWTVRRGGLISAAMLNRVFLTLLALLTGLAAQIGPGQARVCAEQTAAVTLAAPTVARVSAAPAGLAHLPRAGWLHARMVAASMNSSVAPAPLVPSVRIGVDRARQ